MSKPVEIRFDTPERIDICWRGAGFVLWRGESAEKWNLEPWRITRLDGSPLVPGAGPYLASGRLQWADALARALACIEITEADR